MITPFAWPEMFTPPECDEIVRIAEAQAFSDAGLVRGRRNESIRVARTTWLEEDGPAAFVFERVVGTVLAANRQHFRFDLRDFAERVQIACYTAERESHFDWHADIGDGPFAAKRKLTLVAQLSDPGDYAGGVLELNGTGQTERAAQDRGHATLFPSFTLHRVSPVTAGSRYSLTTWVHGPAFT